MVLKLCSQVVYNNNNTPRFLSVLLEKTNHTHKPIHVKQTDNIKHDCGETLHHREVITYEFLSTNHRVK